MEINNFIIFIIIILLSIILYKSAKIFNYNKKENFSTVIGTRDSTGIWKQSLNEYDQLIEDCKGEWTKCSSDTNNECKRTYRISNPGYIGVSDTCIGSNGETQKCTPDLDNCIRSNEYTINGVNFDILKNTTIRHKKRYNINGSAAIQNKEDISERVSNVSSEPNIENDKFEQLMKQYTEDSGSLSMDSNGDEFIGIILERNYDSTSFYPIFINNDSQIEILDNENSTVFIKKNIDCKGKWSPCTFTYGTDAKNYDLHKSERKYFVNYEGYGSGKNNCPANENDTELCAKWSPCTYNSDTRYTERVWDMKKICKNKDENCMKIDDKNNIYTPIYDDCEQGYECNINFTTSDCNIFNEEEHIAGESGIENGDSGKVTKLTNLQGSNVDTCRGYENGKFYRSKMKDTNNDGIFEPANCDVDNSLENCVCDQRDDHALECTKNYRIYLGQDFGPNVPEGTFSQDGFYNLPNNILDHTLLSNRQRDDANCWLQVYNFKRSTDKWIKQNPGLPECPAYVDVYDNNGNKTGGHLKITQDTIPNTPNAKIGKTTIRTGSGQILDMIQEVKNLDINDTNDGLDGNTFIKFEKRNNPYNSNAQYWGELCKNFVGDYGQDPQPDIKNISIAPVNCTTSDSTEKCKFNQDGNITYRNIDIHKQFGGTCEQTENKKFITHNCKRKKLPGEDVISTLNNVFNPTKW